MAEYIERERLKQAFRTDTEHLQVFDSSMYEILMIDIDELPAADVAPVRHGRWIETQRFYYGAKQYECSLCWAEEFWDKHRITEKYPSCPNCGAKMDLEV